MFEIVLERAAEKDLRRLPSQIHDRIIQAVQSLSKQPRPIGAKELAGAKNDWRIRIGDYRVLYEILETARVIRIYRIRHKRDAYG